MCDIKMKKEKSRGFTLVELIATIVIIVIILLLGLVTFNKIQQAIQDRQYKNVETRIIVAAEKYVQDTGSNIVFVNTLINEGYITAENDNNIYDPRNKNESLNCYMYEDGSLKAGAKDDTDGTCKIEGKSVYTYSLAYCDSSINNDCIPNQNFIETKWYTLEQMNIGIITDQSDIVTDKIEWFDRKDPSMPIVTQKIYSTENYKDSYLNREMNVKVTINNIHDGKVYSSSENSKAFHLKIDNAKPIAKINDYDSSVIVGSLPIEFTITDEGSGVDLEKGCIIQKGTTVPSLDDARWGKCSVEPYTKNNTDNPDYLFVKDIAGNLSAPLEIKVSNIDETDPEIKKAQYTYPNSCHSLTATVEATVIDQTNVTLCVSPDSNPEHCSNWVSSYSKTANADKTYEYKIKATYHFNTMGTYTLYAFAKDESGRITKKQMPQYTIDDSNKCCNSIVTTSSGSNCYHCSQNCSWWQNGYSKIDGPAITCNSGGNVQTSACPTPDPVPDPTPDEPNPTPDSKPSGSGNNSSGNNTSPSTNPSEPTTNPSMSCPLSYGCQSDGTLNMNLSNSRGDAGCSMTSSWSSNNSVSNNTNTSYQINIPCDGSIVSSGATWNNGHTSSNYFKCENGTIYAGSEASSTGWEIPKTC